MILAGTRLVNQGDEKQMGLVKAFVIPSAVEISYQASQTLQQIGLTNARLISNYHEALQNGTSANSASGFEPETR